MDLFGKIVDLFYKTVDFLNKIELVKLWLFKQNSNKLMDLLFRKGVPQHLENPPGYGPVQFGSHTRCAAV